MAGPAATPSLARRSPRHREAARRAAGSVAFALALSVLGETRAEAQSNGSSPLVLPVLAVLAIGQQASEARRQADENPIARALGADRPRSAPPLSALPKQLQVPDGYALDVHRSPRAYAEPIDADTMVSVDLLPSRRRGMMAYVSYDQESRSIGQSSDVVRITVELRW